jgi:surface-anchored protein
MSLLASIEAQGQGQRLTRKGLEPLDKGHIDITYIYADGHWEVFLQIDEDKLLPLDEGLNGVPSLAPGDNVMVAADHLFPNGTRIMRPEDSKWDFLGVGPNEPLWSIPQTNWSCVWPGMVVRGPFARYFEDDSRINATDDWVTFHLRDVRFTGISDEGEYTTSRDGHFSTWNTSATRGVTPWMASADGIDETDAFFVSGNLNHAHFTWGFSRRGIYEIDLQATAIHSATGQTIASDVATYHWAVGAYAQWLSSHFSTKSLLDLSLTSPQADPDGDGFSNLHEYAFDTDPRSGESLSLTDRGDITTPRLIPDEKGLPHLCYARRKTSSSPQIQYIHETSRDLKTWQPVAEEGMRTEESMRNQWEIIHLPLPESPSERHYYRVRVTLDL